MTHTDLIKRYIYAVTRFLPHNMKTDIAKELQSLISDMLEGRGGSTAQLDINIVKSVLMELGEPQDLAKKYRGDKNHCLIAEAYYDKYVFLMRILSASIVFGMTLAFFMIAVLDNSVSVATLVLQWLGGTFQALTASFTGITLLFAILSHKGVDINIKIPYNSIDDLPPVPRHNIMGDAICKIVLCIIFVAVFLVLPHIFLFSSENAGMISVFNVVFLRNSWYFIIAFAALGVIRESFTIAEGSYSVRLLISSLIINGASALIVSLWLFNGQILNPDFSRSLMQSGEDFMAISFNTIQYFFLAIIYFALLMDSIMRLLRTLRHTDIK